MEHALVAMQRGREEHNECHTMTGEEDRTHWVSYDNTNGDGDDKYNENKTNKREQGRAVFRHCHLIELEKGGSHLLILLSHFPDFINI